MTSPAVPPETDRRLRALALAAQCNDRAPGVFAGLARDGELFWHAGIGAADLDDGSPHTPDTQLQVASNTKTFTAVMIMQLRDEGRLGLDDTVAQHVPGNPHGGITIRRLLSHTSGLQREPIGDVWDTLDFPDRAGLVTGWQQADQVLPVGTYWHYSNLGYAVLGEVIARLDGREWGESLQARLLDPLGLRRTGLTPAAPTAGTYYVPPYTDVPLVEPLVRKSAFAAAGSVWSTALDMSRWHGFLASPDSGVLSPDTVEEMCQPQVVADTEGWTMAWGLGLALFRAGGRTWVGHTGGLPGSITGFFTERRLGLTGMIMANESAFTAPAGRATQLAETYLELHPQQEEPWRPGTEVPQELVPLIGPWFSEGSPFTFSIRNGRLEARLDAAPQAAPSIFTQVGPDEFATTSGREKGERLVVRRRADGSVRQMNWATYRFTRDPLSFAESVD